MIYDFLYKTLIDPKTLRIRFNKIDRFIRICDETRYLTLLDSEKNEAVYNKIRYLITLKSGISYTFFHYFAKIKVDSDNYLPTEKVLTLHNVIIHIKSVLNKEIVTPTVRYF